MGLNALSNMIYGLNKICATYGVLLPEIQDLLDWFTNFSVINPRFIINNYKIMGHKLVADNRPKLYKSLSHYLLNSALLLML